MAETGLSKVSNYFTPMVERQLSTAQIKLDNYQKMCVTGAIQQIYQLSVEKGINLNDIQNDVNDILLTVASLKLNANADPRQIYFITRNKRIVSGKNAAKIATIEMGIEGDGNDALLANFGRSVAYVHPFWQVREGDEFEYPKHKGIELTPPSWSEVGDSEKKVIKIVYPIDMYTGKLDADDNRITTTEYFITDREQVKKNLLAHMSNNLMWEKDKTERLNKIHEFAKDHSLDEILDSKEMVSLGKVSPAWSEPQSRETMIVRKMRNNIVKKIPKDFSNGMAQIKYEEVTNDSLKEMRRDVTESANTLDFDSQLSEQNENKPTKNDEASEKTDNPINSDKEMVTTSSSTANGATDVNVNPPLDEGEPF